MKKLGFIFLLLLCLAFITIGLFFVDISNVEVKQYVQVEDGRTSENIQKIKIRKEQIYQGNLLLINSKYPILQESVRPDIVNLYKYNEMINGYGLLDTEIYLSKSIARTFSEMMNDTEKEGVNHFLISSGFRDFDEQSELYEEMGADYALPAGYSEHNSGLALDVGSSSTTMDRAPEGKWIKDNAWKYGFILRYPSDKTDVTGIQYEPWHIRYVGLPHSAIMKEMNFVLEEYLDYLKDKKKITADFDGEKYTVSYYPYSENMTINIPENHEYEISGNNIDGVIVTDYE